MCIRDRVYNASGTQSMAEEPAEVLGDYIAAVSYTHLDVYKRQYFGFVTCDAEGHIGEKKPVYHRVQELIRDQYPNREGLA